LHLYSLYNINLEIIKYGTTGDKTTRKEMARTIAPAGGAFGSHAGATNVLVPQSPSSTIGIAYAVFLSLCTGILEIETAPVMWRFSDLGALEF
jgi:hypothetical protein